MSSITFYKVLEPLSKLILSYSSVKFKYFLEKTITFFKFMVYLRYKNIGGLSMALKENSSRVKIASTLKKENKDKLDLLSSETDIPISKLLDKAIELLLNEYNEKK